MDSAVTSARARATLGLLTVLALLAVLVGAGPGPATAAPRDDEGGTAQLQQALDSAAGGYNNAHAKFVASQRERVKLAQQIVQSERQIAVLGAEVQQLGATAYRGGLPNTATAMVNSNSLPDLLSNVGMLEALSRGRQQTLDRLTAARKSLAEEKKKLDAQLERQRSAERSMAKRRADAERALAAANAGGQPAPGFTSDGKDADQPAAASGGDSSTSQSPSDNSSAGGPRSAGDDRSGGNKAAGDNQSASGSGSKAATGARNGPTSGAPGSGTTSGTTRGTTRVPRSGPTRDRKRSTSGGKGSQPKPARRPTAASRRADGTWPSEGCSAPDPTSSGCLTPRTLHALQQTQAAGFAHYVHCFRPASFGEHPKGRACDFAAAPDGFGGIATGADRAYGNRLAAWFVANADRLGVLYVIWFRQIWLPGIGWRAYQSSADPAASHRNHVHLSVQ